MRSGLLLSLFALLFFSTDCSRQEPAPFACSPTEPRARDRIKISYRPDVSGSSLARATSVSLRIAIVGEAGEIYSDALLMERKGKGWVARLRPIDLLHVGPVVMVCAFVDSEDPELFDNNQGDPWVVPFYQNGDLVTGFHYQMFRLATGEVQLPDVIQIPMDERKIKEHIAAELAANPDYPPARAAHWVAQLLDTEYGSEKHRALRDPIRADLDAIFSRLLLEGNPDTTASALVELYRMTDMVAAGDSLLTRLRERFPGSRLVTKSEFEFAKATAWSDSLRGFREFLQNHPDAPERAKAWEFLIREDLYPPEKVDEALGIVDSGVSVPLYYVHRLAWVLVNAGRKDDAERVIRRCVEQSEHEQRPGQSLYSPDEWRKIHDRDLGSYLHTLAWLVAERGDYGEAAGYLERVVKSLPGAIDPILLGNLAEWQGRLGRNTEALKTYDMLGEQCKPDQEVLGAWRTLYAETGGDEKGFEAHLAAIREGARAKALARLERYALSWPAPEVTIRDLEGTEHRLSEHRGKVVVIDFWSTGCGPCVASLPRVDAVARSYADSDDVVFLAVNTMEPGTPEERRAKIEEEWKKLGLCLPAYLDAGMNADLSQSAAKQFKVSAIPRMFIIDREGTILFREYGLKDDRDVEYLKMKVDYALSRAARSVS
jgi:thiol-disulfide isomerase/thioredoxin